MIMPRATSAADKCLQLLLTAHLGEIFDQWETLRLSCSPVALVSDDEKEVTLPA